MTVRLERWGPDDLALLTALLGDPAMMEHLGGPESPEQLASRQQLHPRRRVAVTLLGAQEFEYPKGHFMQCNDWQLDLGA